MGENMTEDMEGVRQALDRLRIRIDSIDDTILDLLNERLELGREIGAVKEKAGLQVLDRSREKSIFDRLVARSAGRPVSDTLIHHLYGIVMAATREVQRSRTIAYLGPEATNTHIAALQQFDYAGQFVPRTTIADVFEEVEKGSCDYGVVPVENSLEGAVNHTLDLLFLSPLSICAETCFAISHDLLSRETDLSTVSVVYSHPQALAQSRRWLAQNLPHARLVEMASTAAAARKAAMEPGAAAVAGSQAAAIYNLQVLASHIEDSGRNTTRFLVIGRDETRPTGSDKTTIMFVTAHVPGALFSGLKPMADLNINLVKLESRPTRQENWNYFFIADLEGHREDELIREAIDRMRPNCLFLKTVGSYARCSF
ncbi:prephenate dehydratase [Desulfobotulus sp. H1]|uniref:Bifunctional chorismate mutase/prephenate dehydratase n=1 Tax=Desulfobotulus pelophilus TaxID=2823377 RepID=A0ABT3N6V6_9BACT|nr:prephenate dehydratase [Desulfobotulus pelophilus]MCW7752777.1 prephenate dehydratase [Desulfobotulus pelophilus]